MKYVAPEIKIEKFEVEDIITASGEPSSAAKALKDEMEAAGVKAGVVDWSQY